MNERLASCHVRLGDCENVKEKHTEALEEYQIALNYLKKVVTLNTFRKESQVHFLMGTAYNYICNKVSFEKALLHFKEARHCLERKLDIVLKNEPQDELSRAEI